MKKTQSKSTFWIGGKHSVLATIQNPQRKIHKIVLHEKLSNDNLEYINNHKVKIIYQGDKFFNKIFKSEIPHQGYAAEIEELPYVDFKEFIKQLKKNKKFINIIALDGINDPRNIGSIIRSSLAFNIDGLLINKKDCNSKSYTLYKAASGAIETIPVFKVSNIIHEINFLKSENFWLLALESNAKHSLYDYKVEQNNVIIFGSEENGIRNIVKDTADYICKIPMNPKANSLNVSNACSATLAIINYLQKQKTHSHFVWVGLMVINLILN